jgi:hypothetical protein
MKDEVCDCVADDLMKEKFSYRNFPYKKETFEMTS